MEVETLKKLPLSSPVLVLDATEINANLALLNALRQQCGVKVLYAMKALPLSWVLQLTKPMVDGFAVSSLFEARLVQQVLQGQGEIHLTTPGIRPDEMVGLAHSASHINFNSLNQYQRFAQQVQPHVSVGIRVNPKLSFARDSRFDPCRPHSKLGVAIEELWLSDAVDHVSGLHFHTVFSALDFTSLVQTVEKLLAYFADKLAKLAWVNLGGGYLFQNINNHQPFINLVLRLRQQFGLNVYIEPGKAVVGNAGYLVATVIDSFVSDGKTVVILDTSINHNPEVFEYQQPPQLLGEDGLGDYPVILAGCTCLAGDIFGEYRLRQPLQLGDKVVFKNVGAYSLIKASRFNGYALPDVCQWDGYNVILVKQDSFEAYCQQWL
jgi:carboxynorspermidine decarboxylase